jgi:pimeloyl-ACP methyl ester carboxylesterase
MVSSWERPEFVERMTRLTRFARVLLFDKRGTGLSDEVRDLTSLEARMDDVRAVMDAAESSHAILVAFEEGARLALLFAATNPERVDALVLGDPFVRLLRSDEHPWGGRQEDVRARVEEASRHWGDRSFCRDLFHKAYPGATYDEEMEEWWVWHVRRGASPGAAASWYRGVWSADVTDALSSVRVPVVAVRFRIPEERIRYLTDRLADARIVDVPDPLAVPFAGAGMERLLAQLEVLASGAAPSPPDRVLATVLFTDIVESNGTCKRTGWPRVGRPLRATPLTRSPRVDPPPGHRGRHRGRRLLRDLRRPRTGHPLCPGDHYCGRASGDCGARGRPHRRVRDRRRQSGGRCGGCRRSGRRACQIRGGPGDKHGQGSCRRL